MTLATALPTKKLKFGNAVAVPVIEAVFTDLVENNNIFNLTKDNTSKANALASHTVPIFDQNLPKSIPSLSH